VHNWLTIRGFLFFLHVPEISDEFKLEGFFQNHTSHVTGDSSRATSYGDWNLGTYDWHWYLRSLNLILKILQCAYRNHFFNWLGKFYRNYSVRRCRKHFSVCHVSTPAFHCVCSGYHGMMDLATHSALSASATSFTVATSVELVNSKP